MVIDIKMCRFENVPWGFRLVGGSDFEFPLTVVKVTEGSIAEQAGMQVGDVIVRINDTAISPLTHDQTGQIIKSCGNVFYFGIQREGEEEDNITSKDLPLNDNELESSPKPCFDVEEDNITSRDLPLNVNELESSPKPCFDVVSVATPPVIVEPLDEQTHEYDLEVMSELDDRPCSVLSEDTERKLVEEEIAAVLSGESEVLKEHNTMGIFPKPGVCMSSDVLRSLNEEAIKTKAEKDKENRKWTTFLQKPDRPIPKSKASIEAEQRAANAYKVTIVKSAPRSRSVSPAPPTLLLEKEKQEKELTPPSQVEIEAEPAPQPEPEPEIEAPTPNDTEVPNLEETSTTNDSDEQEQLEKSDNEKELTTEVKEAEPSTEIAIKEKEEPTMVECTPAEKKDVIAIEKTEEELALEQQLADVQRQLAALSSLPSTIQSTLDAVTKQLADLLPTFKLQQERRASSASTAREISLEKITETSIEDKNVDDHENDENKDIKQNDNDAENCHESVENDGKNTSTAGSHQQHEQDDNKANEQIANDTNEARDTIDKNPIKQQEGSTKGQSNNEETLQMEEEQKLKKQKKYEVIEELEEHLERKGNPKQRSKRSFGPLTPASDRPLVLPGGRRWYRPKDAYNDEFIAETLSAQAELITGTTLGEYHKKSVTKQLELKRVNFMKYQKPEKRIDLDRSEVYKVIHHLDRQPVRGIEVRPPVVLAEADVRKAVHS